MLVNCVAYHRGQKLADISLGEVRTHLDRADCFVWVALKDPQPGGRVPPICSGLQEYFRDVYDHLMRLKQSIDSLRDMVTTAISVNLSLIALQESEVTKQLAAYAALVAVPTMVAGVYGMNFANMPELQWAYGYPTAVAAMVLIDIYLVYRFKKAGWM